MIWYAPLVAEFLITEFTTPSNIADARTSFTSAVATAINSASRFGTILTGPAVRADAFVQFDIKCPLVGAVW